MEKQKDLVQISDSVLISDFLYFVRNKLKSTPVKTVVSICNTFYTDDEYIYEEKKKLCVITDEYCNSRRTEDKCLKNIEDVCAIITQWDSKNEFLPLFASVDLTNVPFSDKGNPSLGQIMASLNDLKKKIVTKDMLSDSLESFRQELSTSSSTTSASSIPWFPDAPQRQPSAPPIPISPSAPPINDVEEDSSIASAMPEVFLAPLAPLATALFKSKAARQRSSASVSESASTTGRQHTLAPNKAKPQQQLKDKSRFRDSSRPRTIIGESVKDGLISVKGADLTVNRYIWRWDNNVTSDGVKDFISKQNVHVNELEELSTKHGRFKSFRLRVKKSELSLIEDKNFWPEGVLLSPFFRGKVEKIHDVGSAAPSTTTNG